MHEPYTPDRAQRLIRTALTGGVVSPSKHACEVMAADGLQLGDCLDVLRAGVVQDPELVNWDLAVSGANPANCGRGGVSGRSPH